MQVVTNVKDIIRSNLSQNSALNGISCAGMEEADGRLFLHVQDMVQHGAKCVLIRCSDTDIVVIAISYYHHLHKLGLKELWVQYSVGTSKRFISAHSIAQKLGDDRACALRGFHAFTGCDSVSFFNGKGKASAWTAWDPTDEQMTRAFKILGMPSKDPPDHILPVLERFVVALYKAEPCQSVGEARQQLFTAEGKPLLFIPCTFGALKQHTRRASYQGGQIWGSWNVGMMFRRRLVGGGRWRMASGSLIGQQSPTSGKHAGT
ncbi:uncharacterized protein LOC127750379 [Frankliniella occidentalis]|uniref:Uncharacterized protein LOC127750379 n=1 Tax=Frankliniella occidentalis TaxID=133901 RepID=A0A9C6XQZ7_FRAOC|nr:uncharacterized protein LOC127750379 [Frankliniella occidentalis]